MKRELIQNVKVLPYTSGNAVDREGFLSGILAVALGTATGTPDSISVKVALTECDTEGGSYTGIKDKNAFVGKTADADGAIMLTANATGNEVHNIDIDLAGCKRFVKVTVTVTCTGGSSPECTATCAIALGDSQKQPVNTATYHVGE